MLTLELAEQSANLTRETDTSNDRPSRVVVWLVLIVAIGFAIRLIAWASWPLGAIESEGAEYGRLAENLRTGVGYVGIVTPGAQLNFNPLFPFLIAAASFITHNYELAGRLVALIMGSVLPLLAFGIGSRLFNRRVGIIAAALTALHPLLIHLSFTVFSEGPYATLLLVAIYFTLRALDQPSIRNWVLVGAAFGMTWLLRAEVSAAFAIALLFALVATPGRGAVRLQRSIAAGLMFLLLALPEVLFIYKQAGKAKLEGKSTIFFFTGKRILAAERNPGKPYEASGGHNDVPSPEPNVESSQRWEEKWAFYGIDSDLKGMGFPMRPHAEVIQLTHTSIKDLCVLLATGLRQNAPELFQRVSSDWLGAPFLPALALLGMVARPWRAPLASRRLLVLAIGTAPVVATLFALWNEQRYYFVLVPFLSIWAANGVYEIGLWIEASASSAGWRVIATPAISRVVLPGLIGLAAVVGPAKGIKRVYVFSDPASSLADKETGIWIGRQQGRAVRIMDLSLPLAFHAKAQFNYFPYSDGEQALRYLDATKVDYIVLRRGEKFTRYYEEWLTRGVPDPRAERLQLPPVPGGEKFVIYRWHSAEPIPPA